jgi:hypothetical protein
LILGTCTACPKGTQWLLTASLKNTMDMEWLCEVLGNQKLVYSSIGLLGRVGYIASDQRDCLIAKMDEDFAISDG